ncbi:MAG: single-stranded DNA-binding protein [Chitinivibrionia bacterium]|nr:single-stranded DNA-binding protein [Chitinivibrionia bacterium]
MKNSKIISFSVSSKEFEKIQKEAKKDNMSVSMYCKSEITKSKAILQFSKFYDDLIKKLRKYPTGVVFALSALMKDEWRDIPKGIKLSMGRQFFREVKGGIVKNVKIEGYLAARTMHYSKSI